LDSAERAANGLPPLGNGHPSSAAAAAAHSGKRATRSSTKRKSKSPAAPTPAAAPAAAYASDVDDEAAGMAMGEGGIGMDEEEEEEEWDDDVAAGLVPPPPPPVAAGGVGGLLGGWFAPRPRPAKRANTKGNGAAEEAEAILMRECDDASGGYVWNAVCRCPDRRRPYIWTGEGGKSLPSFIGARSSIRTDGLSVQGETELENNLFLDLQVSFPRLIRCCNVRY
jgi:hypothetical protein